jgi:ketosteroid isomerase-like protein
MAQDLKGSVRRAYDGWFNAVMALDIRTLAGLLDDGFVYTDIFGAVRDKPGYLAHVGRIPPGGIEMQLEAVEVRALSGAVLVTGAYGVAGALADGTDLSSSTRFTALWAVDQGEITCLAHQATRAVPGAG